MNSLLQRRSNTNKTKKYHSLVGWCDFLTAMGARNIKLFTNVNNALF